MFITKNKSLAAGVAPVYNSTVVNRRLYGLDHLRALAITLVFLYHYGGLFPHPEWVDTIRKFGWTGVDLFFVLSGYLIASQLFNEFAKNKTISFKTFFLKRAFRILPAYWTVVALYFCFPFVREREALAPLWKYLTFTQNLGLDLRTQRTFSHAWSLCIEEQFYLAFPLILLLIIAFRQFRKAWWLLVFLFLGGFAIRWVSYNNFVTPYADDDNVWVYWYRAIYYPTWCRLDGLLTGVSLAAAYRFLPVAKVRFKLSGNGIFLLSLCLLTGAYFLCLEENSFAASVAGFPLVSIGYGAMVLAAISPSGFLYRLRSNVTSTIATLSYAIYLTHKIVIHITQTGLKNISVKDNSTLMFLSCVTTCLTAAWLLNKLVEKPFLKLRQQLLAGHSPQNKVD